MRTLVIHSSIQGTRGKSRQLVDKLVSRLAQTDRELIVTTRDLAATPIPYLDEQVLGALFTPAENRSPEQAAWVALSDALVSELIEADRIVIGVPIYNFGLPAQLKSYFDFIARSGVTFKYGADGTPKGLVTGKQVFVVSSRGGLAAGTPMDTVTPYLRTMLSFLGMDDVTFIAAEGQAMGAGAAQDGLDRAEQQIAQL